MDSRRRSGWAILVWSPRSRRLEILTAEKHQSDRAAYVKDWWNTVNWPYVAERFAQARQLAWKPF